MLAVFFKLSIELCLLQSKKLLIFNYAFVITFMFQWQIQTQGLIIFFKLYANAKVKHYKEMLKYWLIYNDFSKFPFSLILQF